MKIEKYPEKGAIYIGVNPGIIQEIRDSATSLKKHNDIHITYFSDRPYDARKYSCFDKVIGIPTRSVRKGLKNKPHYPDQGIIAKTFHISKSPYQKTLFLDCDIYVCGDIMDLFQLLDDGNFDMAFGNDEAHLSARRYYKDMPECFTKPNLGVILYRKNKITDKFFGVWQDEFENLVASGVGNPDEITFTKALWESKEMRYAILPTEYNCRFIFPYIARGFVKMFHGRTDKPEKLNEEINKIAGTYRVGYKDRILATHRPMVGFESQ